MSDQLTPKEKREQLQKLYMESERSGKIHAVVLGAKGTGKTRLAETCPKPVLLHSFDLGGTETVRKAIEHGDIIADTRFETGSLDDPSNINRWQKEFNELRRINFFNEIGTYFFDPISTFATMLVWQIMKKEGRTPPGLDRKMIDSEHGMRIQDWGTLLNQLIMISRHLSSLPCHTIMTCHIGRERDEALQTFVRGALLPGKSREQIPNIANELWVLQSKKTSTGLKRILLTEPDGEYDATTRVGRDCFDKYEEPNVRNLLEKAGLDYADIYI